MLQITSLITLWIIQFTVKKNRQSRKKKKTGFVIIVSFLCQVQKKKKEKEKESIQLTWF